jgi:DNA-binding winged helix-turn-helix (wHTH) protein/dipeptidyl aminopeptidase/acylaminoacyl peptidase
MQEEAGPGSLFSGSVSANGDRSSNGTGPSKVIRFGSFELRSDTRELLKLGIRIKLQVKPFQVLETLVARPGELVTREELRSRLWPSGTFVDFESGLNTAINRLRAALGESAEHPRFIETLPRLGYRFICPVECVASSGTPMVGHVPERPTPVPPITVPSSRTSAWPLASLLISVAVLGTALFLAHLHSPRASHTAPDFRPLSVRGGTIFSARFLTNSQFAYSASVNGEYQTFVSSLDHSPPYALPGGGALAFASKSGELAIVSESTSKPGHRVLLARSPTGRTQERLIAEDVHSGDWSPDGRLALARKTGDESTLEYPAGHVIFRSQGWISAVRISPCGDEVAFLEHPVRDDDGGRVRIVNTAGRSRILTPDWSSAEGLAWSPSGSEIWFTASDEGVSRTLYSVSRTGQIRQLSKQPSSLRLLDVSRDGRVLLAIDDMRMTMRAAAAGTEADISQFDYSHIEDITNDGNLLLFTESGDAGGRHYAAYTYDRRSQVARRFSSGRGLSLSPDGKQALTVDPQDRTSLTLTTLASGRATTLRVPGFSYQWARFLSGKRLMVAGSFAGQHLGIYYQEIDSPTLLPVPGAPYLDRVAVSPDGRKLAGWIGTRTEVVDLTAGTTHPILPGRLTLPIAWSADGKNLFVATMGHPDYSIIKLDPATEQSTSWRMIVPRISDAFVGLCGVVVAPDADAYAYSAEVNLSRLYVVSGFA